MHTSSHALFAQRFAVILMPTLSLLGMACWHSYLCTLCFSLLLSVYVVLCCCMFPFCALNAVSASASLCSRRMLLTCSFQLSMVCMLTRCALRLYICMLSWALNSILFVQLSTLTSLDCSFLVNIRTMGLCLAGARSLSLLLNETIKAFPTACACRVFSVFSL